MDSKAKDYFSSGIFSFSDAAKLIHIPPAKIRRWMHGVQYVRNEVEFKKKPVFEPAYEEAIDFHDLIELRFIKAFMNRGVSLAKIRKAVEFFKSALKTDFPFSSKKIFTDGKLLFYEMEGPDREKVFLDLDGKGHYSFHQVILSVAETVEYENEIAVRWYPDKGCTEIVVDPQFCFGHPTIRGTRIQASVVAKAFEVEKDVNAVAEWFQINPDFVNQAVKFEKAYPI
ncbi:MAG: DUF433 domain-containing protein [Deltaproteobacteria bacterium]|nr:DUF433 domain-containing protein [Deltaproteobacteria bacterium]